MPLPISGTFSQNCFTLFLNVKYPFDSRISLRWLEIPLLLGDMLISLSLRIIITLDLRSPMLFIASYATPPVSAPSPITAITAPSLFCSLLPSAIPCASESDTELCPVSNKSYSLSSFLVKPLIPFICLSVSNLSALPVSILWTYVWCPTSHTMASSSKLKTLCNAMVSSTTPRFDARCPPVAETFSTRNFLISSESSCI